MESINQLAFLLTLFHMLSSCTCATINQPENDTDFRTEYTRQKKELLNQSDFDITVRPSILTKVNLTLSLTTLNGLDIGAQTLSTTFYFQMTWYDERLTWVPSVNQTKYITFSIKEIWTPNLAIFNNINDRGVLGIYEDGPIPLRVSNNGTVAWNLRVTTTTTCQADITYYPYDTQTCYLYISEWAHPSDEVDLVPHRMVKTNYTDDEEWDLIGHSVSTSDVKGVHDLVYKYIEYMLKFKRRPNWYIPLLMIPLFMLSLMLPWVFILPNSSGEKITFVLTVYLSFMVLSSFVSEKLPSVSSSTSVLNVYLASVLVWGAVMTLVTVLSYHFTGKTDSDKKRADDSGENRTDNSGDNSTDNSDKKTINWKEPKVLGAIFFNLTMIFLIVVFVPLILLQGKDYNPTVLLTTIHAVLILCLFVVCSLIHDKHKFYKCFTHYVRNVQCCVRNVQN